MNLKKYLKKNYLECNTEIFRTLKGSLKMQARMRNVKYAMLCYAKSFQSCPTLCDPIDGSHQAPPSLGFSRQEH